MERRCRLSGSVLSFVFCPAGLILSIIALRQINRTQERGKAFAIAGIVISAIAIVIVIITIIFVDRGGGSTWWNTSGNP